MASSILTRCLRQGLVRSGETLAPVSGVQHLHTSNTVQGSLSMPERLQNIPQAAVSFLWGGKLRILGNFLGTFCLFGGPPSYWEV